MSSVPVAVIVLTFNEERNLPHCLASVAGWARELFVVDSGSTDDTLKIVEGHDTRLLEHKFETHSRQWIWALEHAPIEAEWILALDADHRVTEALRDEIAEVLQNTPSAVHGYFVKRRQIFRGKWIRHGGYYPRYLMKLFRRGQGWADPNELVDHHFYVKGETGTLRHDLVEHNLEEDDIGVWSEKHIRYAARQAKEESRRRNGELNWAVPPKLFGARSQRILWLKRVWYAMPLYIRPFLYFSYRYFFRAGFLDGREGFTFHFLQAFWYRLLVDLKLEEINRAQDKAV